VSAAGEFYTPASVVRLLIEVLEPFEGRVYDPCCGSGGMFVQAEKFVTKCGAATTCTTSRSTARKPTNAPGA
jgi:type I restriction-modification system DNA methylase subunit